jgi:hypothetical protein
VAFYWDNPYKFEHDRPLITSCRVLGISQMLGLQPSNAGLELVCDTFITNIAMAAETEKAMSYSRHRGHYARDRYTHPAFTYSNAIKAAALIERADLTIENRTLPGHRGKQSTLTATPALIEFWEDSKEQPIHDPNAETIIIRSRDEERRLIQYAESPKIIAMRAAVGPINEMLRGVRLDLPESPDITKIGNGLVRFQKVGTNRYGEPVLKTHYVRLLNKGGYRVFTSNIRLQGRFYCAQQGIPSRVRLNMLMNGEPVCELDFSAMHPTMAYNAAGIRMDGSPYEGVAGGFTRDQIKLGLLIVLNARDKQTAVKALALNGRQIGITYASAQKLVAALIERHDAVRKSLCSDVGIRLMNTDSKIILDAVGALVAAGIPCIPIHDSLVVPKRFEGQTRAQMLKSWAKFQNSVNLCSITAKVPIIPQSPGERFFPSRPYRSSARVGMVRGMSGRWLFVQWR